MRLDKFLKESRLIKRRTVAKSASDSGRISINGKVAKAADRVKEGDIISIDFSGRINKVRVINTGKNLVNPKPEELYIREID